MDAPSSSRNIALRGVQRWRAAQTLLVAAAATVVAGAATAPSTPSSRDDDAGAEQGDASLEAGADAQADALPPPTCPAGTKLVDDRTMCGTPLLASPALNASLAAAPTGGLVALDGLDATNTPCTAAVVCAADDGATLLFSDSPESPATDGMLYADTLTTACSAFMCTMQMAGRRRGSSRSSC